MVKTSKPGLHKLQDGSFRSFEGKFDCINCVYLKKSFKWQSPVNGYSYIGKTNYENSQTNLATLL